MRNPYVYSKNYSSSNYEAKSDPSTANKSIAPSQPDEVPELKVKPEESNPKPDLVQDILEDPESVVDADFYEKGSYVEGSQHYLSTGEAAAILHISRDMVRVHIREFSEFLHVSYKGEGKGSHMRIPSTDMELLEAIVRLRKNRHTVEQVKDILRDPLISNSLNVDVPDYAEAFNNALVEILKRNSTLLLSEIKKMMDENTQQNMLLLEENNQKAEQISELQHKVDDLQELVQNQHAQLQDQNALLLSMKELLENQANAPRKKGLFGLFK